MRPRYAATLVALWAYQQTVLVAYRILGGRR